MQRYTIPVYVNRFALVVQFNDDVFGRGEIFLISNRLFYQQIKVDQTRVLLGIQSCL